MLELVECLGPQLFPGVRRVGDRPDVLVDVVHRSSPIRRRCSVWAASTAAETWATATRSCAAFALARPQMHGR
ncbi:hypothetical protein NKG94_34625 [Micromonospora sp. M12]